MPAPGRLVRPCSPNDPTDRPRPLPARRLALLFLIPCVGLLVAPAAAGGGAAHGREQEAATPEAAAGEPEAGDAGTDEFVVYATEPGWLRVGPRSEYDAVWKKSDEIAGGNSEAPLAKFLLARGYGTRAEALERLAAKLTNVQLRYPPPTSGLPIPHLTAEYEGREYMLRLTPGFDEETAALMATTLKFHRALEYDWESEWDVLARHGITPLQTFGGRWLVHLVERSSTEGPQAEDRWMTVPRRPEIDQEGRGYRLRLADGIGGTVGYLFDEVDGPFRSNYTLAASMKRHGVDVVDLWPPVQARVRRDAQPRVDATLVGDDPKYWGEDVLPVQPVDPVHALEDWVVYVLGGRWLTVGTRLEYETPWFRREVIWGGTSEELAEKKLLLPGEASDLFFTSRRQALRALVAELTEISYAYHPNADPRETVTAKYRGVEYQLRLDRGVTPDHQVEHRTLAYSVAQNVEALRSVDPNITPKRRFGDQWLVWADGHSTISGYVKDERWMLIGHEPETAETFRVPDGLGGTFTYRYTQKMGPFSDSWALIEALRSLGGEEPIETIRLSGGGYRTVSVDEVPEGITPTDRGSSTRAPDIDLVSVSPDGAYQGDELGILIRGESIDNAPTIDLGPGVSVKNPAYFGKDEESEAEYWVATATIADRAEPGMRELGVYNADGTQGRLEEAFEVREREPRLCPSVEIVVPAGAADWIFAEWEKPGAGRDLRARMQRNRLLDGLHRLEDLRGEQPGAVEEVREALTRVKKAEKAGEAEALDEALKRWEEAAWDERAIERSYFREASALAPAFTPAEEFQLVDSARRRAACLAKKASSALDLVRTKNYTTTWAAYRDAKRIYDVQRKGFRNLAGSFQNMNAGRLLAAQGAVGSVRDSLAAAGRLSGRAATEALRPHQRRVRDVYLDMGETGLLQGQVLGENALLEQDSYLAGVWAVYKDTETVERADGWLEASAQQAIFGLKYLMASGGGLMGTGADLFKRLVNFYTDNAAGIDAFGSTVSSEITKKIEKSRKEHELVMKGVERLRRYSDEQTADLIQRYTGDAALAKLAENRSFHEQTSGGVRRLSVVYLVDPVEVMDAELGIAIEHAELVVRDMKKAFNARVLAEPNGKFRPFKRVLTDPTGVIRVAIQNTSWGGDHYSGTQALIAEREAQIREMEFLRESLRRVEFDPSALRDDVPMAYTTYLELADDHPEFLQWTMVRDRLQSRARKDRIQRAMERADSPVLRGRYERQLALNGAWLRLRSAGVQPRLFQLQGIEKLMVWDYDGALEAFYQAAELDPKGEVQPRAPVEALREELNWQKTVDAGLDAFVSLGNMGFHAAMFEYVGMVAARSFPLVSLPHARLFQRLTFDDFAEFAWTKLNPLHDLTKAALVQQEKVTIQQAVQGAVANLGQGVVFEVVQKDLIAKGIAEGYLGVDAKWADFLASAVMGVAQSQQASGRTLFGEVATALGVINRNFRFDVIDMELVIRRNGARRSTADLYKFLRWADEFEGAKRALREEDGPVTAENAADRTADLAEADAAMRTQLEPLDRDVLQRRYEEHFGGEDAPAPGSPERLVRIREFLRGLPWKDGVMELGLARNDRLNRQVDNLRRELLATAQVRFLERHPDYAGDIVSILFIGSAGDRNSDAYKLTDSDIDFTILVRDDLPESRRGQLRDDFMRFFQEMAGGRDMEGLDMAVMVDPLPAFDPTGESVDGFLSGVRDPARRNALRRNLESTIEQLIRNASDPERYLDRGNLFRHNLFVRLGGKLKRPELRVDGEGAELVDAPASLYDELYGDVPLEPWMAFDAVVGNMGYVFGHAMEKPTDIVHYQKVLAGKYALRGPLFALVLSSPVARQRLKDLTRAEVDAKGWDGPERILVEITKEILAGEGGMRELGLPTTLEIPGEGTPRAMNEREWGTLLEEWILRKEGKPLTEVLGRPRRLRLEEDHRLFGELMGRNIAATEAVWKAALRKTIMDQATALQELRGAAREAAAAGDRARADVIELKMKEIFLSQAAIWSRMSREQQLLVMKEMPPEADWWVALDVSERLRQTAGRGGVGADPRPAGLDAATIRAWRPRLEETENSDTEFLERIRRLQEEAAAAPDPQVLNAGARAEG